MNRQDILNKALEIVTNNREDIHGRAENSFKAIAAMWQAYLDHKQTAHDDKVNIEPHDVALMMGLLKIVRAGFNPGHKDNFIDLAGYAACAGESESEESEITMVQANMLYRQVRDEVRGLDVE